MKIVNSLLASLLFTVTGCANDGYQSIFDGKTLDGWHIMQQPEDGSYYATTENFFVEDGAIHCFQTKNRKGGMLLSDGEYQDFELEIDFKTVWGCDSGIMLRCDERAYGIQILNDYLDNGNVGFLFGQGTGAYFSRPILLQEIDGVVIAEDAYDGVAQDKLLYSLNAEGWNSIWKQGDWNTIKIRCVGTEPHITTWINGTKLMEMDGSTLHARSLKDTLANKMDAKSAWNSEKVQSITGGRGHLALQIHNGGRWKQGSSVMYKNIRIKELK